MKEFCTFHDVTQRAVAPRVGWVPIARLLFPDTPSLRHTAPLLLNIPDSPFIAALAEARDGSGGRSSVVVRWSQDVGVTWGPRRGPHTMWPMWPPRGATSRATYFRAGLLILQSKSGFALCGPCGPRV